MLVDENNARVGTAASPLRAAEVGGPPTAWASGRVVAAAAGSVIADTGQLAAGDYLVEIEMAFLGTVAAGKGVAAEHRNAANSATLHQMGGASGGAGGSAVARRVTIATNERIRVVQEVVGGAGEVSIAGIRVYAL
jgi:hypothetical protein